MISLGASGAKLEYTPTNPACALPLTLAACHPSWDDYLDLNATLVKMAHRMMEEDGQQEQMAPKVGATPKKKEAAQTMVPPALLSANDSIIFIPTSEFPGTQHASGDASNSGMCPLRDLDVDNEAKMLGHFSDTLHKMAASIIELEDGYFKALHEVIVETEKALWDISWIDTHYVSHVVMVMASWQEAVQAASSHMENVNLTIYLAHRKDARRARKEYVATVIRAREECDATHAKEQEARKEAIKADDPEDPVIHLLHVTCKAAHAQAEKAMDAFLTSIEGTLQKHVPISAQGPLIANTLSMAFQFQMSVWQMISDECIRPLWAKHSDWCGLAGIVQAIVEIFHKNFALMFPPAPALTTSFAGTFKPVSSEDDDDDMFGTSSGICRFESSLPMPSGSGHGGSSRFGCPPAFLSTPLPHGGAFVLASDRNRAPRYALGAPLANNEERGSQPLNEDLDMGLEADDEGDRKRDQPGDDSVIDLVEVEILKGIISPGIDDQPPTVPKSGNKWGSTHLDGGSGSSDSSGKDLDAKGVRSKKKGVTPTKVTSNPSQWTKEDIDIVHQICYKTDLDHFQMYRQNKIDPTDLAMVNTKDHSAYIEVAKADPSTVIQKSVFSMAAYREVL